MDAKPQSDSSYYLIDERKFLTWRPLFLSYANTLNALVHLLGTQGAEPAGNDAASRDRLKVWLKGRNQAIHILIKYIPKLQYVMLRAPQAVDDPINGPTSAERWTALVEHCNVIDSVRISGLRESLEQVRHNPKDKVGSTIAKLAEIVETCRNTGDPSLIFTDDDIAKRLLRVIGRDSNWSPIVESMLASESAAAPITLHGVETRLKSLQQQRDDRKSASLGAGGGGGDGEVNVVQALYAKIESLEKQVRHGIRCFNCNEDGHTSKNCKKPCGRWLTNGKQCGSTDHTSATCNNAAHHSPSNAAGATVEAILDSGAEEHIVPDAKLVNPFHPFVNDKVFVQPAGGDLLPVVGAGSHDLKSHDGKIIQLDDVLVVPGVKWALISVARLVEDGSREVVFRKDDCVIRDTTTGEVFRVPMNDRGAGLIALHYPDVVESDPSFDASTDRVYQAATLELAIVGGPTGDTDDDDYVMPTNGIDDDDDGDIVVVDMPSLPSDPNTENDIDDGNDDINNDGDIIVVAASDPNDSGTDNASASSDDNASSASTVEQITISGTDEPLIAPARAVTRSGLTTNIDGTTAAASDDNASVTGDDSASSASTAEQITAAELEEFDIDPDTVNIDGGSGKKKLINLLHERLGHLNFVDVKAMLKGDMTSDGEKFKAAIGQTPDFCVHCAKGKARRAIMGFNKYTHQATRNNYRFFLDVKGPIDVPSMSGAFYYAVLKDDYSRYMYVIFLQRKSDLFDAFMSWRNSVENQMDGATICKLRMDGGGENVSAEFKEELAKLGIEIEQTSRDTPEQNAVAERSFGSIQTLANAMHSQSGRAKLFWPFFVKAAVRTRNRSPTSSLTGDVTPFERRFDHKPSIRRERVIGSLCYVYDPLAGNFDDKGIEGIFLGHSDHRATYIVYVPSQNKMYHSIHVAFDETYTAATHPDRLNRLQIRTYQQAPYTFDQKLLNWEAGTATDDSHQVTSAMIVNPLPTDAHAGAGGVGQDASTVPLPTTVAPASRSADTTTVANVTHADLLDAGIDIENPDGDALFAAYGHLGAWATLPEAVRLACTKARQRQTPDVVSAPQIKKNTKDWWGRQLRLHAAVTIDPTVNMVGIEQSVEPQHDVIGDGDISDEASSSPTADASIDSVSPRRSTRIADATQRRTDALIAAVVKMHLPLDDHNSVIAAASAAVINMCPQTIKDVEDWERSADHATRAVGQQWRAAIDKEIAGLEANGCWEYIDVSDLPTGAKILKSGHTFKIKSDGTLKDRFVAKGYSQRADIDFHDIYAAVVRTATLRTVLAICNLLDWDLAGIDFVQAFVNGDLEEEIFIHPPAGSEGAKQGKLCRLRKTLYGLKQSARRWNEKLTEDLISIGFVQSDEDDCLFTMFEVDSGRPCAFITVYVDDCVIACKPGTLIDIYKKLDTLDVEYTRCDVLKRVLNITISRDRKNRKLTISQPDYSEKMLETFGMIGDDIRPAATPQVTGAGGKLDKSMCPSTPEEEDDMASCPYRQLIGTLLHLTMQTRPDLAMSVGEQARFMTNPGRKHWEASKRILRYVKDTVNDGIVMDASKTKFEWSADGTLVLTDALHVYVDASYADDGKSRSTGGFVATLAGGIVSYKSTRLTDPPTSTAHAEIAAAYVGAQEAIWLVKLLGNMGISLSEPPVLLEDNKAAIAHSHDANFHGRLRHLGTKYHFTRRQIKLGLLSMKYVMTTSQCADMFTKALPREAFHRLRSLCGISDARL